MGTIMIEQIMGLCSIMILSRRPYDRMIDQTGEH